MDRRDRVRFICNYQMTSRSNRCMTLYVCEVAHKTRIRTLDEAVYRDSLLTFIILPVPAD